MITRSRVEITIIDGASLIDNMCSPAPEWPLLFVHFAHRIHIRLTQTNPLNGTTVYSPNNISETNTALGTWVLWQSHWMFHSHVEVELALSRQTLLINNTYTSNVCVSHLLLSFSWFVNELRQQSVHMYMCIEYIHTYICTCIHYTCIHTYICEQYSSFTENIIYILSIRLSHLPSLVCAS